MLNYFTLRAECKVDVDRLKQMILVADASSLVLSKEYTPGEPDQLVDIEIDLSKDELIKLMQSIPDGHVMIRTLQDVTASRAYANVQEMTSINQYRPRG